MVKNLVSKKAIHLSVIFGLLCAVFVSFADFNIACDELRTNVLRLHIIANSDSEADQSLKLMIRDELLLQSEEIFAEASDIEGAISVAENSLEAIEQIANGVLKENGAEYPATASVGEHYFETREYEDFTLPAGNYKSLIIDLGAGKGKNWWCVIFPEVCIPAASDGSLSDAVTEQGTAVAENPERYVMRFKTVEIYEKIKKSIRN